MNPQSTCESFTQREEPHRSHLPLTDTLRRSLCGYSTWYALALSVPLSACSMARAETHRDLPVVRAEPVSVAHGDSLARYSSVVRPDKQVQLEFKSAGYVRHITHPAAAPERLLQAGDRVRAGEVLAVVDTADYGAKLEEARAAAKEAQVAEDQAKSDQARWTTLVAEDARPKIELERYESQLAASRARRARAIAVVHAAELALEDCTLRAPFSGVVFARTVEQGALVTPHYPGFVLADTSVVKVAFGAPDAVAATLHTGDAVTVEIPVIGRIQTASVSKVAPAADPKSRLFDIEVNIPNTDSAIKPGVTATVSLRTDRHPDGGALIPLTALVRGPDTGSRTAVFVVVGEASPVARLRAVDVRGVLGSSAVVTGVTEGEQVATLGAPLLHDNAAVRLLK